MMNKKGKGTNLTFFLIGMVVFVGVIWLIFSSYSGFMKANSRTIDPNYVSSYQSIIDQNDSLSAFSQSYANKTSTSIVEAGWNTLVSTVSVGISAISSLMTIPKMFQDIFTVLEDKLNIPPAIMWMVSLIVTIFVFSKIIKAWRGQIDEV